MGRLECDGNGVCKICFEVDWVCVQEPTPSRAGKAKPLRAARSIIWKGLAVHAFRVSFAFFGCFRDFTPAPSHFLFLT